MLEHERIREDACGCRHDSASGVVTHLCPKHEREGVDRALRDTARFRGALEHIACFSPVFEEQLHEHGMVEGVGGVKEQHPDDCGCLLCDAKTFLLIVQEALEVLEAKP